MTSGVALLHYSCPPVVGGVEEVLHQQALLLVRHGHRVLVLAGQGGSLGGGIEVALHPLLSSAAPEVAAAQETGDDEAIAALTQRCLAVLREHCAGFSTLVAHNVLAMPFNLPLTLAVRRLAEDPSGPAVLGWNHDSPYLYPEHDSRLDSPPWTVLRDPAGAVRWITISSARQAEFAALYGGVVPAVVPNGIDPARFLKLEPSTTQMAREQGLLEADLVLVQPSRLHPRKNVELSIRVLRALRDTGRDARLVVTGAHDPHDPSARGYARRLRSLAVELGVADAVVLVAEYVFADGVRLQPSEVVMRDLYHVADVLFLPSRSEGFGLPLLEAGLIRLPVACADIPVLRGIGGEDVYRFRLDARPEDIAAAVVGHLDALPTHRWYRRILTSFTWERIYRDQIRPLLVDAAGDARL